jgi:hypothetical protein
MKKRRPLAVMRTMSSSMKTQLMETLMPAWTRKVAEARSSFEKMKSKMMRETMSIMTKTTVSRRDVTVSRISLQNSRRRLWGEGGGTGGRDLTPRELKRCGVRAGGRGGGGYGAG